MHCIMMKRGYRYQYPLDVKTILEIFQTRLFFVQISQQHWNVSCSSLWSLLLAMRSWHGTSSIFSYTQILFHDIQLHCTLWDGMDSLVLTLHVERIYSKWIIKLTEVETDTEFCYFFCSDRFFKQIWNFPTTNEVKKKSLKVWL